MKNINEYELSELRKHLMQQTGTPMALAIVYAADRIASCALEIARAALPKVARSDRPWESEPDYGGTGRRP